MEEQEEQKHLLEKRAQYIEATKNLLKSIQSTADTPKSKSGRKVSCYPLIVYSVSVFSSSFEY